MHSRLIACSVLVCLAAVASPSPSHAARPPAAVSASQISALDALQRRFGAVRAEWDESSGAPRWLAGVLSGKLPRDEAGFRAFLRDNRVLLGVADPDGSLALRSLTTDDAGHMHASFQRVYRGLDVWSSELVVHMNPAGVVTHLTAHPHADFDLPSLSAKLSANAAVAAARARLHLPANAVVAESPILLVAPHAGGFRLAYRLSLVSHEPHLDGYTALLDAQTGEVLERWTLVHSGFEPKTGQGSSFTGSTVDIPTALDTDANAYVLRYYASQLKGKALFTFDAKNGSLQEDFSSGSYKILLPPESTDFTSPNNLFKDPAGVDGHRFVGKVFDYFAGKHGWVSWDGQGSEMTTLVHYESNLNNAFWFSLGRVMAFGDGDGSKFLNLTRCLDVAGHEMTHAVISGTVDLVYQNESGALNESLADTFGTFIDPPTGKPSDFQLGEDCMGPAWPRPFLRHMKRPDLGDQPGHNYDFLDLPNDSSGDHGGVHYNSGITNRAAAINMAALGVEATEKLYFQLLKGKYVTSGATFAEFRTGLISACESLFKAGSKECNQVTGSLTQVGIFAQGEAPTKCPAGSSPDSKTGCRCDQSKGLIFDYSTGTCVPPGSAGSCGDVPAGGACEGSVIKRCEGGQVVSEDCGAQGKSCSFNVQLNAAFCEAQPQGCGAVPATGVCEGTTVRACVNGSINETLCGQQGQVCTQDGSGAKCTDPPSCKPDCSGKVCGGDGCGGLCGACGANENCTAAGVCEAKPAGGCGAVTYEGSCQGKVLTYCDGSEVKVIDCGVSGLSCEKNEAKGYFDCSTPPSAACALPPEGVCEGAVLKYCDGASTITSDCGEYSLTCGPDPALGGLLNCLGSSAPSICGDVTYQGQCNGNTVVFCEADGVKKLECNAPNVCGWNETNDFYDCIPGFASGAGGAAGSPGAGGSAGAAPQAGGPAAAGAPAAPPAEDSGGCSVASPSSAPSPFGWLGLAVGAAALLRRRR